MRKLSYLPALIAGLALAFGLMARAQETVVGRLGLSVSPPIFELSANPGETLRNQIRLENTTESPLRVSVLAKNFTALGEEGQPGITEEPTAFSLSSWIQVTPASVQLGPKASQVFSFTIAVPANAEPGGHFGSVIFKAETGQQPQGSGAAVAEEIGSLVLLKVAGPIVEQASIESFKPAKAFFETGPVKLETRIRNEGNVHFKPTGSITVTNLLGREVARLKLDSKNVLPDSVRRFETTWDKKRAFGRYRAQVALAYGSKNQLLTASTVFWVIPYKLVAAVLVFAAILGLMLYRARARVTRSIRILFGKE